MKTRRRPRLSIPQLSRIRDAPAFDQVERRLNNDQVYYLERLFQAIFGRHFRRREPADWAAFQLLIPALDSAVNLIDYFFDRHDVAFDDHRCDFSVSRVLRALEKRSDGGSDPVLRAVLHDLARDLRVAEFTLDPPDCGHLAINSLVLAQFLPTHRTAPSEDVFDVFVSYKTRTYLQEADSLRTLLEQEGLRCWFDRERLRLADGDRLDKLELKRLLKTGLEASRLTVFFETYAEATADEDFRGDRTAFNWQVFEHRYSERIVYVRPPAQMLNFADGRAGIPYRGLQDLAKKIVELAKGAFLPTQPLTVTKRDWNSGSRKELREAATSLRASVAGFFKSAVEISARTTLLLLAPRVAGAHGSSHLAMGGDVLVSLVRLSPFAMIAFRESGIDPAALVAVGAKPTDALWAPAGEFRMQDLFGSAQSAGKVASFVTETGLLGDAGLLLGLLDFARRASSSAHDLLLRTLRYMRREETSEQDWTAAIATAAEAVATAAGRGSSFESKQQWLMTRADGGVALWPFGEAGVYHVSGLEGDDPTGFVLNCLQLRTTVNAEALSAISAMLASGSTADLIDEEVSQYPTLEFELSDIESIATCVVYGPTSEAGRRDFFLTHASPAARVPIDIEIPPSGPRLGRMLIRARAALNDEEKELGPSEWGWRRESAVILGSRRERTPVAPEQRRELSLFDLESQVLAPLWRTRTEIEVTYEFL
jgi:hypothetical protein